MDRGWERPSEIIEAAERRDQVRKWPNTRAAQYQSRRVTERHSGRALRAKAMQCQRGSWLDSDDAIRHRAPKNKNKTELQARERGSCTRQSDRAPERQSKRDGDRTCINESRQHQERANTQQRKRGYRHKHTGIHLNARATTCTTTACMHSSMYNSIHT